MAKLNIGWSEVSITPDKKISLAGQFAERISEYVEKPITVTAMAVEAGDDQMILCSVDLGGTNWNLVEAVRQNLAGNDLGIDPRKVILSAIHTHTGPSYTRTSRIEGVKGMRSNLEILKPFLAEGQEYVPAANVSDNNPEIMVGDEMLQFLIERITRAVIEAWQNRAPGSFTNAFGRAAVGMCRRVTYSDGTAQMWGNTNTAVFDAVEGGSDTGIELMYIHDEAGKLTGIVANLACPAQCVQHRLFVSPDFWGEAKMLLRKHFGEDIQLLALCSAAGDQCPVDLVRWVNPESDIHDPNCERDNPPKRKADPSMFDLAGMRVTGRRIAREIIDVYEEGLDAPQSDIVFTHKVSDYRLPLRRATLTEAEEAKRAIKDYLRDKPGNVDFNDIAKLQRHLGILGRMELQDHLDCLPTEVHVIRMGSVAFATNPFELFLDYGNQIKARALCEQTFLVQLACGAEGYLPTAKAEQGGHYSAFLPSGKVGHIGGEVLVRQTLEDINSMFR